MSISFLSLWRVACKVAPTGTAKVTSQLLLLLLLLSGQPNGAIANTILHASQSFWKPSPGGDVKTISRRPTQIPKPCGWLLKLQMFLLLLLEQCNCNW